LLGRTRASPKSKKVCQSMNRRGARRPPRRSAGSSGGVAAASNNSAKNWWAVSVALVPKLAR
jgi:hypothetical protein